MRKTLLRIFSLLLIIAAVIADTAIGLSATGCIHNTVKGIVDTEDGFKIANVCTLCRQPITDIGYVKDTDTITLYDDSARTVPYPADQLKAGFSEAGKQLYTPEGVLISTGKPYWLSFDLDVLSLPTLIEGDLNDNNSRAYKGCSVICTVPGGNYFSQLRLIYDGWEADGGASGSGGTTPDGKAPIKLYASNNEFRNAETVIEISNGDKLHFDMRIDPSTGAYDVYIGGFYKTSGKTDTTTNDSNSHVRFWEYDGGKHGGNFKFTNIKIFYDNYTVSSHTHSYTNVLEFYDKGLYRYETCVCGIRNELESQKITAVVADGLAHIYNGLGDFTVNSDNYWFVTDINIREEIGDGSLLKFGNDVILEVKDGKLVSDTSVLGSITYPTTYQITVEIENGSYNIYANGRYAASGTVADTNNITCGDEGFESHVRFLYNKAVTLGETATPAVPTYTFDKTVKICYHSDGGTDAKYKMLAHTNDGVEYIYNCSLCGERVYSMLKKDLTNPANDTAYKYKPNAIIRSELKEMLTSAPKYLYLENNVISKNANPYWLTFDVTPKSLPSMESGSLNSPNSRAYKGYALVSTEAAYIPASELRVIPDGWETDNASGTTKGVTDGKCEVKIINKSTVDHISLDTVNYRLTETVAYLEVNKTTSFALRIDPQTGIYDVYVNGIYKGSSQKLVSDDLDPKILFHDNGLGEFTYSNINVCEEAQSFDNSIISIDFTAKAAADETASENAYTSLLAIQRGDLKYNLFYYNNKTATLAFKDIEGNFNTLYGSKGAVTLTESTKLAVVYDDINGDVRYFVDDKLASCKDGFANAIKLYDADFVNAEGADSLRFDVEKITSLNVMGLGKTDTAEIVGFQSHEVSDTIRLLSGLDSLYYGAVGVEVKAYQKDGTPYNGNTAVKTTGTLYSSVIADNMPLPASKYGYNHFAAITIDGSFTGYKDSYIIVKPFTIIGNDKYYGEAVRLNILDNGSYEFAENN